jgi:hypothetical protein
MPLRFLSNFIVLDAAAIIASEKYIIAGNPLIQDIFIYPYGENTCYRSKECHQASHGLVSSFNEV